jgi:thiamine pyrophosphate-dependent acetolactate synthase large subunit-like protein
VSTKHEPTIADLVGETLGRLSDAEDAFGVLGSGNLVVTNALCRQNVRFHHARHEGGAVCMADGYARTTGHAGLCSVHQGPGLTNTVTGLAEAAKSRTPLVVLAGETPATALTSNFRIDQHGLVESVGAIAERIHSPQTAVADTERALHRAETERRPVVLMLPIDVQARPVPPINLQRPQLLPQPTPSPPEPQPTAIAAAADVIADANHPVIIAGRGAVLADADAELEQLGERIGALLATSAPAHGLFAGRPYGLGIAGGFASPLATELLGQADLILAFGASLNHWTTKHGALFAANATLIQVDLEPTAIGRNRPVELGLLGDARATARALADELKNRNYANAGFRTAETQRAIANRTWENEPYEDAGTERYIDPRTLSISLDELLPPDRVVAVDSGHFTGYPSMYLDVPDARSWIFANGFQAVGLGLGNAIGAAIAHPDRTTVAVLGDGGAFMALSELETAVRLRLGNLLVVVYDDSAYGAEVHHFAPMGHDVSRVRFADADLARIATAAGAQGQTVRRTEDLQALSDWLEDQPHQHMPLVLDAKVNPDVCAEWLEEAFRAG